MDFFISLYPMDFRSKRWPTRVILHMLSMSLLNAWIEYRERKSAQGTKKNIMDLLSFREHVAETLCKAETNTPRPVGRPSYASMLNYCPIPNKKTKPAAVLPNEECRYYGLDHWPQPMYLDIPQRCKLERCTGKSLCEKCDVYLCLTKGKKLL